MAAGDGATWPAYVVDAKGKVVGAVPPALNNWGRWGEDDERGTSNLISPELIVQAAGAIRTGEVFSLAIPIENQAPLQTGKYPVRRVTLIAGSDYLGGFKMDPPWDRAKFADDMLIAGMHSSTHWDGFTHLNVDDVLYNGFWGGSMTAVTGAAHCGIQHQRASMVGRGILLDVCRAEGGAPLAPGHAITAAKLDEVAAAQGVEIRSGDILFVRTGFMATWYTLDPGAFKTLGYWVEEPGLAIDTARWMHEHDIAAVASDNWGVEVFPAEDPAGPYAPLHEAALVGLGLSLGEFFWLDDLAEACANDGRWDFFVVAPPLNVVGATGSMLNPIVVR